jgi:hypothetical protein
MGARWEADHRPPPLAAHPCRRFFDTDTDAVPGPYLTYSSSLPLHCLPGPQVWDLAAGVVRQTVEKAHSGTDVPCITDLTVWEGHIVSASLDGLIKIWEPADPASGLIINPTPIFSFPEQVGRGPPAAQRNWSRGMQHSRGNLCASRAVNEACLPMLLDWKSNAAVPSCEYSASSHTSLGLGWCLRLCMCRSKGSGTPT